MKGKWALFGGITVFAAALAGAFAVWKRQQPPPPPPPQVKQEQPVSSDFSIQGKVEAREVIGVKAPSDGTIEEYLVIVGEEVFEGQLLARIKNPSLEAEKERAKEAADKAQERVNTLESQLLAARLESARARAEVSRVQDDFARTDRIAQRESILNKEGATPRLKYEKAVSEFQTARLEYESSQARQKIADTRVTDLIRDIEASKKTAEDKTNALEEVESDLQSTLIHSPADGIVLDRRGDAGADVKKAEDDVFRIATDLGQLQVVIEPPPPVLAKLAPGMPAMVFLAENAGESLNAEINRIDKDGRVVIFFGSPDPSIKPGVTAQVKIALNGISLQQPR
ncbi:MAG: HlyD family efflux transporter periplasmic adaptor subunit [Acidobacteria bacterium]|nr:HlyD family efflux transporter periplasmic adaptor subunit [Acidobacteriota bacterium]